MDVREFLRGIGSAAPAFVYLFCPSKSPRAKEPSFDPFLAEEAIDRFVQTHIDPAIKDLAYAAYYADEADPAEIVLEAQSVPFLAERRVILVRNAERYLVETAAGPLLDYIEAPVDTAVLLLLASRVDKRTRFYKLCEKVGQIVECPQLTEREVAQWVREKVASLGKTIEPVAVQAIVSRTGTHLSDVSNAVALLSNFVGNQPAIREEDVRAACADVAEEEVWALTDAIAGSDMGAALSALRRLIELGKAEDELMGIINWLLRSAYAVAVADQQEPKLSPFVAKKVTPLAGKLGLKKLRDAFSLCNETHYMMRSTGVNASLALELLVVKLAAPIQRRHPS